MEYLEGQDLDSEIAARGRLPVEEAVGYMLQACSAVAEAHALGIVHRDLKPHNLFLTGEAPDRVVKLLDFGISKMPTDTDASSVTLTRSSLGTPLYMSPEQIRSAKRADKRSDIWSLGVIMYEVLTGTTPFEGESPTAVIAAITADTARPPHELRPGVPRELSEAIMRALAKDPALRYQSVIDFAESIQPFGPPGAWMPSRLATSSPSNPRISIIGISDAPTVRAPPARLELVQTPTDAPEPIPVAPVDASSSATTIGRKRGAKSVALYASLIVISLIAIVAFLMVERRLAAEQAVAANPPTAALPSVSVQPLPEPRVTPVVTPENPQVEEPRAPIGVKSPSTGTKAAPHPSTKAGSKAIPEKAEPPAKPTVPPAENPLHL
jgi:serine/threonine-protein kinase